MNIAADIAGLSAWRDRRGLVVFVRHGERESVPSHEFPRHDAPLTEDGRRAAESLGALLGDRLGAVRSSPVPRCVDTALALIAGARRVGAPTHDQLLGDPGAFVVDGERAMAELVRRGFHPAARQLGNGAQLPGFADPDRATQQLLALAHSLLAAEPSRVHVLVTHDLILSTMVARVRGVALEEREWSGYLHGLAVWRDNLQLVSRYAAVEQAVPERLMFGRVGGG
ncbi:MAG: histidine phosphatase family protein [Phycisphaerales bacterium]|nr:histidine phosphatase family protein [Phycisphaerales bacterium]